MTKLVEWLQSNVPASERSTLVHGDFRLDNLIYKQDGAEVLAVLDWELSTLGDPLTDLATVCLVYYLPSTFPVLKGLNEFIVPETNEFLSIFN